MIVIRLCNSNSNSKMQTYMEEGAKTVVIPAPIYVNTDKSDSMFTVPRTERAKSQPRMGIPIPVSPIVHEKMGMAETAARVSLVREMGLGYVHTIEREVYVICCSREAREFAETVNSVLPPELESVRLIVPDFFEYSRGSAGLCEVSYDPAGLTSEICGIMYVLECATRGIHPVTGGKLTGAAFPFRFAAKYMGYSENVPSKDIAGEALSRIYYVVDVLLV
jgi:hypothetical protein